MQETPVGIVVRGAAAGLAATALLSALSRILPGLRAPSAGSSAERARGAARERPLPEDRHDPGREYPRQQDSPAPAAVRDAADGSPPWEEEVPPAARCDRPGELPGAARNEPGGSAGALTQSQSPGPEGLAEQFAFKVASGLFGRDISPAARPVGVAVHLAYGSAWGMLYGLLQSSYRLPTVPFGIAYGVAAWLAGPAFLAPAMKLMRPPLEEPPVRTTMLLAGHVVYGAALAAVFEALHETVDEG
jgi:hypothetical protein